MVEEFKFWKETYHNRWGKRIYEVSNYGRVKINGKLYQCKIYKDDYYYYLCGKLLHRIVAELFLPDWDPNLQVDHIDTNRLNNMVSNLRMVDSKGNANNPLTRKHISEGKQGYVHTEEWKQQMSLRNSGEGNPFYGRKHTEKTRNKIINKKKGTHRVYLDDGSYKYIK